MDVIDMVLPTEGVQDIQAEQEKITPAARYYRLHREERLAKRKEEYNTNPSVIAKRVESEKKKEEREKKKAEEKLQKQLEKERKVQERITIAKATSQKKP
jgi:hypothetical protein